MGIAAALIVVGSNLVLAPIGAILVLVWAWLAKVPWRDLGFSRPRSWAITLIAGVIAGVLLKLLLKALVMPLLGAPETNAHFHFIVGNRSAMVSMILASVLVGGIAEEILYRGFLFERLGRLLGQSRAATIGIVLLTTAFFASIHIPEQGFYGAMQAAFTGLASATIFAVTRRLWFPIAMHAAYDVTAVIIIYLDLETRVAHALLS